MAESVPNVMGGKEPLSTSKHKKHKINNTVLLKTSEKEEPVLLKISQKKNYNNDNTFQKREIQDKRAMSLKYSETIN